jgi:hypothetical protein
MAELAASLLVDPLVSRSLLDQYNLMALENFQFLPYICILYLSFE